MINVKNIKVGGIYYDIECCPVNEYFSNGMGRYVQKDSKIYINSNLNDDLQFKTLIHELLHAVVAEYKVFDSSISAEFEEDTVDRLTTGVYDILCEMLGRLDLFC